MPTGKMREGLAPGTQIVVENKTGSGGKIAVDALRASPADGGTLLLAPLVTLMPSQLTFKNPGYNPATDMTPIGVVGHFQFALTVPPNHPAKNIAEFVTWLKANKKSQLRQPQPPQLAALLRHHARPRDWRGHGACGL